MTKHIIFTIVDGLHYRYLVDTGVVEEFVRMKTRILLLTIPALRPRLEKQYLGIDAVSIELLEDVKVSLGVKLYLALVNFTNTELSATVNIKNELSKLQSPWKSYILNFLKRNSQTKLYQFLLNNVARIFKSPYYRRILKDFKPDLAVFSTPGQKIADLPLLYECINAKIKTVSPVYSWDNLTAKGPFVFRVDYLIVWNEIMRDEAIKYHRYAPEKIFISGVPVFDPYRQILNESNSEKVDFKLKLKLPAELPLITVTTIPQIFFGSCHINLINKILSFMDEGKIPPCAVLVRPHPKDVTNYSVFKNSSRVVVDLYGSTPDDSLQNWVPLEDNILHLGRTMKYSDIVINIASTITIDAACFNTPVINIAYDMKDKESDYWGSILRYYSYSHYSHVVQVGGATMVKSDSELASSINDYLSDRSILAHERKMLVRQQTGDLDGKAYLRVVNAIKNIIDSM